MIYIFIFFSILIASMRKLVFLPDNLMIGHNWDWTFPAIPEMFKTINFFSKYTWWSIDLGTVTNLNISHIVPDTLVGLFGTFLSPVKAVVLLIAIVLTVSFFGFKKLLDMLAKPSEANYIGALLYAFSPFLFNEIIGGSWYMWISYAVAPLFFLLGISYVQKPKMSMLVSYLISSIFLVSSLQNFVLTELIFLCYIILFRIVSRKNIKHFIVLHTSLLVTNIYWLLPFLLSLSTFSRTVTSDSFTGEFVAARNSTQDFLSIISLIGYWDRNIYIYSLSAVSKLFFWLSVFVAWSLILISLGQQKKKSGLVKWLVVFLAFSFLAKGGNQPFSNLTMWIFKVNPFMSLYRSPQHLIYASAFIAPILLSLSLSKIDKKFSNLLGLLIVIFWVSGWWVSGDFGEKTLNKSGKDSINYYSLTEGVSNLYKISESDKKPHRILSIPSAISPFFIDDNGSRVGAGGQAEYLYLVNSTFNSESNDFAKKIDDHFCDETRRITNLTDILSITNTKYIISRKDILPQHTHCKHKWNFYESTSMLIHNPDLEVVASKAGEIIFKVTEKKFYPRMYINLNLQKQNDIYEKEDQKYMTFERINPAKYKVSLRNVNDQFKLVFLENFNRNWQVYGSQSLFAQPISVDHKKVFNYANIWLIEPSLFCENIMMCNTNNDGSFDFTFYIEFTPQRYFYLGLIATTLFLVTGFFILSKDRIKSK